MQATRGRENKVTAADLDEEPSTAHVGAIGEIAKVIIVQPLCPANQLSAMVPEHAEDDSLLDASVRRCWDKCGAFITINKYMSDCSLPD